MVKFYIKYFLLFFILAFVSLQSHAQSVGGTISGASTFCSCTNSGFLTLQGYTGSILGWESSTDGGVNWTSTSNILSGQSYNNLCTTTCYRAIVQQAGFPPDTSAVACNIVFQPSAGGTIAGGGTFCAGTGNGTLTLSGNVGNPIYWQHSTDNGATWTNDPNTTVTLNYANITQNTIYQAVVQNGPTCPLDTSAQVTFMIDAPSNGGIVSGNDTVCYSVNSGNVNSSGNFGSITNWVSSVDNGVTWTNLSNTTAVQNYSGLTQTTLYAAVAKNGSCPSDTSTAATILVILPTPVSAGIDTTILLGASATLHGVGNGTISWSPSATLSNNTILNPVATPVLTTAYVLTLIDTNGCINADAVTITVTQPVFSGAVSNLFTPNGDGINDTWYIQDIQSYPENEVFVYNIYGNKVYEKKGYSNDWKGTYNGAELPDGTYYYILKIDDKSDVIKGSLDILRNK